MSRRGMLVEMATLAGDVCRQLQPLAGANSTALRIAIPSGLWASGDLGGADGVLVAMVRDAISRSPSGRVLLMADEVDSDLLISVSASESTFPPEPRVNSASAVNGALTDTARALGGAIRVDVYAGLGTVTTLTLHRADGVPAG